MNQSNTPTTEPATSLKIVADDLMPLVDELFSPFAEITKRNGRSICDKDLFAADALLCRSVTKVDQKLVGDSPLQFVGSATIGIDHLDVKYLAGQGIEWRNAAGCNAAAVAQYVLSAASFWCLQKGRNLRSVKIGIVGAGHVGSCLADYCQKLKIKTMLCDPPLQRQGDTRIFHQMSELMSCDVISFHVPITDCGRDPTLHMVNAQLLAELSNKQLLINASRGAVVDNNALLSHLSQNNHADVVLDVFETEPAVNKRLIEGCLLATPHIAGHTLEGKVRGSWLIYQAFCQKFSLQAQVTEQEIYPPPSQFNLSNNSLEDDLLTLYPIAKDSARLKALTSVGEGEAIDADSFDYLRKNYLDAEGQYWRRDYEFCQLTGGPGSPVACLSGREEKSELCEK